MSKNEAFTLNLETAGIDDLIEDSKIEISTAMKKMLNLKGDENKTIWWIIDHESGPLLLARVVNYERHISEILSKH